MSCHSNSFVKKKKKKMRGDCGSLRGNLMLKLFSEVNCVLGPLPQTSFMGIDRDRSGSVDARELQQALTSFGYNLSPQALNVLEKRYAVGGKIAFDSFVGLCVRLRLITSKLFVN